MFLSTSVSGIRLVTESSARFLIRLDFFIAYHKDELFIDQVIVVYELPPICSNDIHVSPCHTRRPLKKILRIGPNVHTSSHEFYEFPLTDKKFVTPTASFLAAFTGRARPFGYYPVLRSFREGSGKGTEKRAGEYVCECRRSPNSRATGCTDRHLFLLPLSTASFSLSSSSSSRSPPRGIVAALDTPRFLSPAR